MATDKLMNHTQGESIITNLSSIASNLQNVTAISPAKFGMGYAVCDTAAATAAKTATIANYTLTEGALVTVKFTNGSTSTGATLNLNDTGAKNILYKGQALTSNIISAGDICTFIYSTNAYNIINLDALSGAGAGTVRSIGAEGGLITDQTSGAAIQQEGNVKLNLKSQSTIVAVGAPDTETTKTYPVALDSSGYPGVAVPWTDTTYSTFTDSVDGLVPAADGTGETGMFLKGDGTWATPTNTTYSQGSGINIDANNEISNTGVTAISPSSNNGNISVTTNGSTADVAVTGLNNAAYKDVDSTIDMSDPSSNVPTSAAVSTAITNAVNALPEPMVFKGTVNGTYPATPNVGDTYKATANSTSGVTPAYKMGDTVIYSEPSTGTFEWVVIPSGDEPSGTVTGITGSDGIVTLDATTSSSTISTSGTAKLALVTNHTTSVNAGNATSTANRSYPVAIDGNSKLAVNVPWENTTYANGTGITIGSGNAINHSNSVTEVTTAGAYKVKYDAQGHITGTAALSASDISAVPTSRTVNSKALTGNITLSGDDLVLTNYVKGSSTDAVAATDKVNAAIAKHENRLDTCQTNILYSIRTGAKNQLKLTGDVWNPDVLRVYWDYENGTVRVTGSTATTKTVFINLGSWTAPEDGVYRLYANAEACKANVRVYDDALWSTYDSGGGASNEATWTKGTTRTIYLRIANGFYVGDITITPMICQKSVFDADSSFEPHAASNRKLTVLEEEDRDALTEVIDSGAKNKWANGTSGTVSGWRGTFQIGQTLKKGTYIIYFDSLTSTDTDADTCQIIAISGSTQVSNNAQCPRGSKVYTTLEITSDATALWIYSSNSSGTGDNDSATFTNGMICTLAEWKVSQEYVPHRMNYQDLCDKKEPALSTTSKTSGSLDDIAENSFYLVTDGTTGRPVSEYGFVRTSVYSPSVMLQEFISFSGNASSSSIVFVRVKQAGTWQSWKQLTNA